MVKILDKHIHNLKNKNMNGHSPQNSLFQVNHYTLHITVKSGNYYFKEIFLHTIRTEHFQKRICQ